MATASPGRGRDDAVKPVRGQYKCGKCGFFPKAAPHPCVSGTGRPTETGNSQKSKAIGSLAFVPKSAAASNVSSIPITPAIEPSTSISPAVGHRRSSDSDFQGAPAHAVGPGEKNPKGGPANSKNPDRLRCFVCSSNEPDIEGAPPFSAGCGCRRAVNRGLAGARPGAGPGNAGNMDAVWDAGVAHVGCLFGLAMANRTGPTADRDVYFACPTCRCDYTGEFQL